MTSFKRNQRISALATRLPLQRQQLAAQSDAVTAAVRQKLSSPAVLAVATLGGGVLGWCLFRDNRCKQTAQTNAEQANQEQHVSNTATTAATSPSVATILRQSAWAWFMAYLARNLV